MNKIIVAGCSVSDYTEVDKVWGEHLAELLNLNYLHAAAGCGSNYRIWRTLSKYIFDKIITPGDILIVQYTTLERNEFWSPYSKKTNPAHLRDEFAEGSIIRFKTNSHLWYQGFEKKLLKNYERFINLDFEIEKFISNHMMFQCLAKEFNINNLYFITVGSYGPKTLDLLDQYKNNYIKYENIFNSAKYRLPDYGHLSAEGHQFLAKTVYKDLFK
jgi:hypothetical protein